MPLKDRIEIAIVSLLITSLGAMLGCTLAKVKDTKSADSVAQCIQGIQDQHDDLCAEESSCYADMNGKEAYYAGVACAVEFAKECVENPEDVKWSLNQ